MVIRRKALVLPAVRVAAPKAPEPPIAQQCPQVESQRQHVLPFRDPCRRLRHERVQRENSSSQARPRHRQPPQQPPKEPRIQQMQQDVLNVVCRRPETPQLIVQPEAGPGHGIVLLQDRHMAPHGGQAREALEQTFQLHRPGIIIPNKLAVQTRAIGPESGAGDEQHRQPAPLPPAPHPPLEAAAAQGGSDMRSRCFYSHRALPIVALANRQ